MGYERYKIIDFGIGGFNDHIGKRWMDLRDMVKNGIGENNLKGRLLLEFCNQKDLCVKNTWFKSFPPQNFFSKFYKIFIWHINLGSKTWFKIIFDVFEFWFDAYWIKIILGAITHMQRKLLYLVFKKEIF